MVISGDTVEGAPDGNVEIIDLTDVKLEGKACPDPAPFPFRIYGASGAFINGKPRYSINIPSKKKKTTQGIL